MVGLVEVKLDYDLDHQNPCWVGVRLLRVASVLGGFGAVRVYRTARGLHVRAYVPPMDGEALLRLRGLLNDDYGRINLDWARYVGGLLQWDILFTARWKSWSGWGVEEEVSLDEALDEVIELCASRVQRSRRR